MIERSRRCEIAGRPETMSEQKNSGKNLRTALILLSVVLVFFLGVIIKQGLLR